MQIVDHIFITMLFLVQPIYGYFSYKRYVQRTRRGEPSDRVALYKGTITLEWVAFTAMAAAWLSLGRPATDLGLVASTPMQIWVGSGVLVLAAAYLFYTRYAARRMSADQKEVLVRSVGDLIHVLPQSKRDYRYFVAVSMTAGIVEELLYRAFTFWYLAHFMPTWAVVAVSSVAFGLGHSYQGVSGMVKVATIGVGFGLLYVYTGSIWLPMLTHAILDIVQGIGILEITRRRDRQPIDQHTVPR